MGVSDFNETANQITVWKLSDFFTFDARKIEGLEIEQKEGDEGAAIKLPL
jgi:hypothetical protein